MNTLIRSKRELFRRKSAVSDLRYKYSVKKTIDKINSILNKVDPSRREVKKNGLFGNPLPKDFSSFSSISFTTTEASFFEEIKWFCITFHFYNNHITTFSLLQEKYEEAVLKENFTVAFEILNEIEVKVCKSVWGLEQYVCLLGKVRSEHLRNQIAERLAPFLNLEIKSNFISSLLSLGIFSLNKDFSVESYKADLDVLLSKKNVHEEFIKNNYLKYKSDFLGFDYFESLKEILSFERLLSVVDRFLSFKKILSILTVMDEKSEKHEEIGKLLRSLNGVFDDLGLNILHCAFDSKAPIKYHDLTVQFLTASDLYTVGDYRESTFLCREAIESNSNCFEFYTLYLKSGLYAGKTKEDLTLECSDTVNCVIHSLYDIFCKTDNYRSSLEQLEEFAYKFSSFNWGIKLYLLLIKECSPGGLKKLDKLPPLFSTIINIKQALIHPSPVNAINFLERLSSTYENGKTILFWEDYYQQIIDGQLNWTITNIPLDRKEKYTASILANLEDSCAAIDICENAVNKRFSASNPLESYLMERITGHLYGYYLKENRLKEASILVTNLFAQNKNLIAKLDLKELIYKIKKLRAIYERELDVSFPIVFYIANENKHSQYIESNNLIRKYGLKRPSEISTLLKTLPVNHLIVFMYKVLATQIIRQFPFIKSTEIYSERIKILQLLTRIDNFNRRMYEKEIENIVIQSTKMKSENFPFRSEFVNKNNIVKAFLKKHGKKYLLAKKRRVLFASYKDALVQRRNEFESVWFTDLFCKVTNFFLNDPVVGLDIFLSLKFRHDYLIPMLRSPFVESNLVSSIEKGEYTINDFFYEKDMFNDWDNFQEDLSMFSESIDLIIEKFVKIKLVPSQNENCNSSLFLYAFQFPEIEKIFNSVNLVGAELKDIISSIVEMLIRNTENSLGKVTKYIKGEMYRCFNCELEKVEASCVKYCSNQDLKNTIQLEIAQLKKGITGKCDEISELFIREPSPTFSDFLLFDASLAAEQIIQNLFTQINFVVKKNVSDEVAISGEHFNQFVDVFMLMFQNVIKYTPENKLGEIECNVSISFTNPTIQINIQNLVKDDINIEFLENKIKQVITDIDNKFWKNKAKFEGGSGILKAQKILEGELQSEYNVILPSLEKRTFNVLIRIKHHSLLDI